MATDEQELKLEDVVRIFSKKWKFIILTSLCAAAAAYAYFHYATPIRYESYSLIKVGYDGKGTFEAPAAIDLIMNSKPMLLEIAKRMHVNTISEIGGKLEYTDKAGLLNVSAITGSPEKSAQLVQIASGILMERHQAIYEESKKNIDTVVRFIKQTIKPIPLSSGINEFKTSPSQIVIPPVIDTDPLKTNTKMKVIGTFIIFLALTTLISFMGDDKRNKKS
jgi:capsular polysaccharide biosynthesis protein